MAQVPDFIQVPALFYYTIFLGGKNHIYRIDKRKEPKTPGTTHPTEKLMPVLYPSFPVTIWNLKIPSQK